MKVKVMEEGGGGGETIHAFDFLLFRLPFSRTVICRLHLLKKANAYMELVGSRLQNSIKII